MLNFFREYSYSIIKMLINQVGMTVFGLILSLATSQNEKLLVFSSIFSIVFYMFLLYTMSWDVGARDKIRVDGNRAPFRPLRGLWMSICANSINILLALLIIFSYYVADITVTTTLVDATWAGPTWAASMFASLTQIARFVQAMYLGILATFFRTEPFPFIYLIITVPAMIASATGYFAGLINFRIGYSKQN